MQRLIRFAGIIIATVWIVQLQSSFISFGQSASSSQEVTWTCTGSPCPWGATDSGHALVWPDSVDTVNNRLGYTTSAAAYLPASEATGTTIMITSGTAGVYAGEPNASSHRRLATLANGDSYVVSGLAAGEVLSVQSGNPFDYEWTTAQPPTPTPTFTPMPTFTSTSTFTPTQAPVNCTGPEDCGPVADAAPSITWSCTDSPCPWGATDYGHAIVWPTALEATNNRLGYTASGTVYLPASVAMNLVITISSGSATVYAGEPDASSHHSLRTLNAGDTYVVSGLTAAEVLSVQSSHRFDYEWALSQPPTPTPTLTPTATFTPGQTPANCTGPEDCEPVSDTAPSVTWTCTGSPCPWGATDHGHAIVWPAALEPTSNRLGYTASSAVYLPVSVAADTIIIVTSGSASVYAGEPNASSHRRLATLASGDSYAVSGLANGEVLSVQSSHRFDYEWAISQPSTPTATATPTSTFTPTPTFTPIQTSENCTGPDNCEPISDTAQAVTWTCTDSPCPWGATDHGHAVVWPAALGSTNKRLGYTASGTVYLPASVAADTTIAVTSGSAAVYAGEPNAPSHRHLATLASGSSYKVVGLAQNEVISVQGGSSFAYAWSNLPEATPTNTPTAASTSAATATPVSTATPVATPQGCVDPTACHPVSSINAFWRCDLPGCQAQDWVASVIAWPSWSAYPNNARSGSQSRTVYSATGEMLHPYMGSWAHGCEVTAVSGRVLIIEWERGTDVWRETPLLPGQSHTISLVPPENGAMIETFDYDPIFSVSLANCTPEALPATASATLNDNDALADGSAATGLNEQGHDLVLKMYLPLISTDQAVVAASHAGDGTIQDEIQPVQQLYLPLISTR